LLLFLIIHPYEKEAKGVPFVFYKLLLRRAKEGRMRRERRAEAVRRAKNGKMQFERGFPANSIKTAGRRLRQKRGITGNGVKSREGKQNKKFKI